MSPDTSMKDLDSKVFKGDSKILEKGNKLSSAAAVSELSVVSTEELECKNNTGEEFIRNKPREVCGIGCGKLGAERSKIRSRIQNFPEGAWAPAQDVGAAA
ncbi:hypothetical protein AgCh_009179 [Apium graveolens]